MPTATAPHITAQERTLKHSTSLTPEREKVHRRTVMVFMSPLIKKSGKDMQLKSLATKLFGMGLNHILHHIKLQRVLLTVIITAM